MAKITKILSTKVDEYNGKAEILLRITINRSKQVRVKSGLFIKPIQWSAKKNAPKSIAGDAEFIELRNKLSSLESFVMSQLFQDPEADKEWICQLVHKFHFPEKHETPIETPRTLLKLVAEFIENAPNRRDSSGRNITKKTIYQYGQLQRQLKLFTKKKRKRDWTIPELDQKFYDMFVSHMYEEGYMLNTVGKHIKNLKVIINSLPLALRSECELVNSRMCKKLTEEIDNVYLTERELELLYLYDFSNDHAMDQVRDWFLCLCWTGSRYSDLGKINSSYIKNGMFQFRQQKTNSLVVIPVHPVVRRILDKYNGTIPPPITNQKFNHTLKRVCQAIGLTNIETIKHTIGGKLIESRVPKYELISSHTGRRSFASNMYLRDVPSITIMQITGHKTEAAFLKYIKITPEQHATKMGKIFESLYGS